MIVATSHVEVELHGDDSSVDFTLDLTKLEPFKPFAAGVMPDRLVDWSLSIAGTDIAGNGATAALSGSSLAIHLDAPFAGEADLDLCLGFNV